MTDGPAPGPSALPEPSDGTPAMLAMFLVYLVLTLIFLVAGVGVWILRGYGFSEFRRSGGAMPPPDPGRGDRGRP